MQFDDEFKERCDFEVEALKSIYFQELTDLRDADPWKVWRPPELLLHLLPSQSVSGSNEKSGFLCVDLIIKCRNKYPQRPPSIEFRNAIGLAPTELETLVEHLVQLSEKLKGEVMILELAQEVQHFLYQCEKARLTAQKTSYKSFYEEMLGQQEVKSFELELEKKKQELKLERIEFQELRADTSENAFMSNTNGAGDSGQNGNELASNKPEGMMASKLEIPQIVSSFDVVSCGNKNVSILKGARKVNISSCSQFSVFSGLINETGSSILITECCFRWKKSIVRNRGDNESIFSLAMNDLHKQLDTLHKEYQSLCKLESHRNLISYLAFDWRHSVDQFSVILITPHQSGFPVSTYLHEERNVSFQLIRRMCCDVLEALRFLHLHSIIHRQISAYCIWQLGDDFKISDLSLTWRLLDWSMEVRKQYSSFMDDSSDVPSDVTRLLKSREQLLPVNSVGVGRLGRRSSDIYMFGCVALQLALGSENVTEFLQHGAHSFPKSFPNLFRLLLKCCLSRNEQDRWTAEKLLQHDFLTSKDEFLETGELRPTKVQFVDDDAKIEAIEPDDDHESVMIPSNLPFDGGISSRLQSEFDICKHLGQGAFGSVFQVRNKLDGGLYALKRVVLNPKSKQFNKKITREVKLLSRLNHENVVRYYNSWIETISIKPENKVNVIVPDDNKPTETDVGKEQILMLKKNIDPFADEAEFSFAPPQTSAVFSGSNWTSSLSGQNKTENESDDSASDSESIEIPDIFFNSTAPRLDDDTSSSETADIIFGSCPQDEPDSNATDDHELSSEMSEKDGPLAVRQTAGRQSTPIPSSAPLVQYLYIQMEYCEKSTLRRCIDLGELQTSDMKRPWRYFREITEGLAHIHEQGMIHRDLKPGNIFLDSHDHIKIGDFGLATVGILQQTALLELSNEQLTLSGKTDNGLTSQVGTALYVSPELTSSHGQGHYTQKVDVYSLGVILFELFSPPLLTKMERFRTLSDLRLQKIMLPWDFEKNPAMAQQTKLLYWLLQHDPDERPNTDQILESDLLPPIEMEENEFQRALRNTLANTQTKQYRNVINSMFERDLKQVEDFAYDSELFSETFHHTDAAIHDRVTDKLVTCLRRYGAVYFSPPSLLPKSKSWLPTSDLSPRYFRVVDTAGQVLYLPYDLRTNFARYVARSNVQFFKRYCIGKVFRQLRGARGIHPRELFECAFDIVSTNSSSSVTAELFLLMSQMSVTFSSTRHEPVFAMLKVNHYGLLRALLMHLGIDGALHDVIVAILADVKNERIKDRERKARIRRLGVSDKTVCSLYEFLDTTGPLNKVSSLFRVITKRSDAAADMARSALRELEALKKAMDLYELPFTLDMSLNLFYNVHMFKGLVFQFLGKAIKLTNKKHEPQYDVFAAGGHYEWLVDRFRKPNTTESKDLKLTAVGVSISVDKLCALYAAKLEIAPEYGFGCCDTLICSTSSKAMTKEKRTLQRELLSAGISASVLEERVDSSRLYEIHEYWKVAFVVLMTESTLQEKCPVSLMMSLVNRRYRDIAVDRHKLVNELQRYKQQLISTGEIDSSRDNVDNAVDDARGMAMVSSGVKEMNNLSLGSTGSKDRSSESEKKSTNVLNVTFSNWSVATKNTKDNASRRRKEAAIINILGPVAAKCSSNCKIECIATDLPGDVFKEITCLLDWNNKVLSKSDQNKLDVEYGKYKKSIVLFLDCVKRLDEKANVLILYSYGDNCYKVLM